MTEGWARLLASHHLAASHLWWPQPADTGPCVPWSVSRHISCLQILWSAVTKSGFVDEQRDLAWREKRWSPDFLHQLLVGENLLICLISYNFSWNVSVFVSSAVMHMFLLIILTHCFINDYLRMWRVSTKIFIKKSRVCLYCLLDLDIQPQN